MIHTNIQKKFNFVKLNKARQQGYMVKKKL